MNNVSFGSLPRVPRNLKLQNATSGQFARVINDAYAAASKKVGESIKPSRVVTSKSIRAANYGLFEKHTGKLTEEGLDNFLVLNKDLGLQKNSTVADLGKQLTTYIVDLFNKAGSVYRRFDYFIK